MFMFSWFRFWPAPKSANLRRRRRPSWQVESLDDRLLLSALTPAQVSHAYGVDKITFGTVRGDGTGQTIAIVDAYAPTNINTDVTVFDTAFGIKNTDGKGSPVLTIAAPFGNPGYNSLWAEEATLDVEWEHAIAPDR